MSAYSKSRCNLSNVFIFRDYKKCMPTDFTYDSQLLDNINCRKQIRNFLKHQADSCDLDSIYIITYSTYIIAEKIFIISGDSMLCINKNLGDNGKSLWIEYTVSAISEVFSTEYQVMLHSMKFGIESGQNVEVCMYEILLLIYQNGIWTASTSAVHEESPLIWYTQ